MFTNHYANSSWTKPSFASLFTSKNPQNHKVRMENEGLSDNQVTLTEELSALGYSTHAVVSQYHLRKQFGFNQGFDVYKNLENDFTKESSSIQVSDEVIEIIEQQNTNNSEKKPFFIFAHYFDPHVFYIDHQHYDYSSSYQGKIKAPIHPALSIPRPWQDNSSPEDVKFIESLHLEEISFTDSQVQRVFERLDQLSMSSDTIVVITSDHGEEFLEHGQYDHRKNLYQETVHVPLLIRYPGIIKPARLQAAVSLVDVMPTILDFAGLKKQKTDWEGVSLRSHMTESAGSVTDRPVFFELSFGGGSIISSILFDNKKLIHHRKSGKIEYYDLTKDPNEKNNLAASGDSTYLLLKKMLDDYNMSMERKADFSIKRTLSGQELEKLKTLGYIN